MVGCDPASAAVATRPYSSVCVSVLDRRLPSSAQPVGGVVTEVAVLDVENSSRASPSATVAGSVTRAVVALFDDVAEARNAMVLAGGSVGATSWLTAAEAAPASSVTTRLTV